jgi:hypothetical protein
MSSDRDRYNLEADNTVDDETKRRLRGKSLVVAPIAASLPATVSHSLLCSDNQFEETIVLTAAMVATPYSRRCGISFKPLKNHHNTAMTTLADGVIISYTAPEIDIELTAAYVISKNEVVVKTMSMPFNHLHGGYSGKFLQSHGAAHTWLLDPEHNHRMFHYTLIKFPLTHPIENLFSELPTGASIDPKISWFAPPTTHVTHAEPTSDVHWPVALSNSKVRFQLAAPPSAETPMQRAMREARTEAQTAARSGNLFHSNPF